MPQKVPEGWKRDFHKRAGESHAEARKFLTAMAVGMLAILYATLTGKEAPTLADQNRLIAILAIIILALSAGSGLAAWRADAAWAFTAGNRPPKGGKPDGGWWHEIKKWCDYSQLGTFLAGLLLTAILTLRLMH
jgi:heme A synthase